MAGAIVPIISGVEAVAPMIPSIIQGIEALFGKGTGAAKLQAATSVVQSAASAAVAAGKAASAPTVEQAATAVQSAVDQMQAAGQLPPHTYSPPRPVQSAAMADTAPAMQGSAPPAQAGPAGLQTPQFLADLATAAGALSAAEQRSPGVMRALWGALSLSTA